MLAGVGTPRWTPDELRSARPDVLDAARWALFAQRIWPGADVEAQIFADDNPSELTVKRMKREGRTQIHALRKVLLPPDEASDG